MVPFTYSNEPIRARKRKNTIHFTIHKTALKKVEIFLGNNFVFFLKLLLTTIDEQNIV